MTILCDVLRPFWLRSINRVTGNVSTSFKAWLTDGQYVFSSKNSLSGEISFYTATFDTFIDSIAHDVNRMAMAAFESIHGIPSKQDIPRSTAWTLIRAYYAAFFAAHAICRVFSIGISQLDKEQIKELNKALTMAGESSNLGPGVYRVMIDPTNNRFSILCLKKRHHEATWKEFGALLESLVDRLLKGTPDRPVDRNDQDIAVFLMNIVELIRTSPCRADYNWLSYIRNELNYQHKHGAWYPHVRVSRFKVKVVDYVTGWKKDPTEMLLSEEATLPNFSKGCALIVALMREIIEDLDRRNPSGMSFLQYGAMRVLKQTSQT